MKNIILYTNKELKKVSVILIIFLLVIACFDIGHGINKSRGGVPGTEFFLLIPWVFNLVGTIAIIFRLAFKIRLTKIPWGTLLLLVLYFYPDDYYSLAGNLEDLTRDIKDFWRLESISVIYFILLYFVKVFYLIRLRPFTNEAYLKSLDIEK